MADFLLLALLAGLGVALVSGPLGAFVVWRRMAYFGDTLAHSALLGVAAGLWFSIAPGIAVIVICLLMAIGLLALQRQQALATDTLLGILSHSSLALGLIAMYLIPGARVDLESLLFGDLLAVTALETLSIWLVAGFVLGLIYWLWTPLLSITVHEDLAQVEGVNVGLVKTCLMLTLALVIAIAMKVVGVLLITALMVIPAATARRFAISPAQMAVLGSVAGMIAVCLGIAASWWWDTPMGPSIVLSAGLLFLVSLARRARQQKA
ncbi:MAG: membrane protein [Gammaproteobacteria bacterium BRH_c0]|nr:MAG: membrane protein [Gammaproteobacteria bacterium BRH_c0]